jgi:exopolysaccharide biosynthesis polyprenyl glycosylphosphotransferase
VASENLPSSDVLAHGSGGLAVDRVILATPSFDEQLVAGLLAYCRRHQIKLSVVPPIRGMFGTAVQLDHVADLPFVQYNTWDVPRSTLLLKRAMDVGISLVLLMLLAPLFLLVALAIRLDSRGPASFNQRRAGREGRPFRMYKFRTMVANAEDLLPALVSFDNLSQPMFKLHDDPRVTRVGRLLRRTSLDELPQLVNILRGEMSLVGPRPEQVELVDRYSPEERFRLTVKPGLTGPMQVYGRGRLTFAERLALEREYIENLSLGRDLRMLALTFYAVVSGQGAF